MKQSPDTTGENEANSFIVNRPVAILMVFLAATVFGLLSYGQLSLALLPELTYPTLTVRTEYPGAAPEEVENDISRPVEETLGVVNGLVKVSSISRADISDVVMEFGWDTDISDATQDVLERLDLVQLPEEAQRPLILHYDPSLDPVLELSLSSLANGADSTAELKRLRRGQTTILVSHRVSTARHSDRIVMLDEGRIVEMGSHADLIALGGQYAELERIQREGADDADYQAAGAPA